MLNSELSDKDVQVAVIAAAAKIISEWKISPIGGSHESHMKAVITTLCQSLEEGVKLAQEHSGK